jgi:hypothetical protein
MVEQAADVRRVRARIAGLGGRTAGMLAVLALLVAAADRTGVTVDASVDRRHTLSESLLSILRQQEQPVELVTIWGADYDEVTQPIAERLEQMAAVNPRLAFRAIDPELHKPRLSAFAGRYGVEDRPALYVCRGERAFKIPLTGSLGSTLQREVGGALVSLSDPNPPAVHFLQGHGELRPKGGAEDGSDHLVRDLELNGFTVNALDLAQASRLPNDGVLVIAGPTASFAKRELHLLDEHLTDGGATLLLADDRMSADLASWLRRRGILMGPGVPRGLLEGDLSDLLAETTETLPAQIVVSMQHHFVGQESEFPYQNLLLGTQSINPKHPATTRIAGSGQQLLSPWTTAVAVPNWGDDQDPLAAAYSKAGVSGFTAEQLLKTLSGDTWSKRREDPLQAPGDLKNASPAPLAWAITWPPASGSVRAQETRLVVWGSRQAASDGVLSQGNFANGSMLVSLCRWLSGRGAQTEIPLADSALFQVQAGDGVLFWITAGLLALLPCAFIGIALAVWWEKR